MLETLHISNYALIDAVDIRIYPGLDIITGETGAGKSIMLGALSLLLGGRTDTKAVRSADRKSVIEAVFAIEAYPHLRQVFAEADIDWDPPQRTVESVCQRFAGAAVASAGDSDKSHRHP